MTKPDDRSPSDPTPPEPARRDSADGPPIDAPGHGAPRIHPIDGRRREWTLASHLRTRPPQDLS